MSLPRLLDRAARPTLLLLDPAVPPPPEVDLVEVLRVGDPVPDDLAQRRWGCVVLAVPDRAALRRAAAAAPPVGRARAVAAWVGTHGRAGGARGPPRVAGPGGGRRAHHRRGWRGEPAPLPRRRARARGPRPARAGRRIAGRGRPGRPGRGRRRGTGHAGASRRGGGRAGRARDASGDRSRAPAAGRARGGAGARGRRGVHPGRLPPGLDAGRRGPAGRPGHRRHRGRGCGTPGPSGSARARRRTTSPRWRWRAYRSSVRRRTDWTRRWRPCSAPRSTSRTGCAARSTASGCAAPRRPATRRWRGARAWRLGQGCGPWGCRR